MEYGWSRIWLDNGGQGKRILKQGLRKCSVNEIFFIGELCRSLLGIWLDEN